MAYNPMQSAAKSLTRANASLVQAAADLRSVKQAGVADAIGDLAAKVSQIRDTIEKSGGAGGGQPARRAKPATHVATPPIDPASLIV